ncbi:MAG: ribosome silencing factor [Alphaproteobacteria bacterium]|nr:ribosome silencing factor [Alphaproteobacteria bacterium]
MTQEAKKTTQKEKQVRIPQRTTSLSKDEVTKLLDFMVKKLDEGKAENIVTIDLAGKTSFADYLLIATGTSSRHVFGLANNLSMDLKKAGYRVQISGENGDGNWIVIDAIDIVVHLFTNEAREFYRLEEIWNKA